MKNRLIFLSIVIFMFSSCAIKPSYIGSIGTCHKNISFLKSFSPDVIYYKLYVSKVPNKVTYKSNSYIIREGVNGRLDELTSRIHIDLIDFCEVGKYNIGISAVNDVKEESRINIVDTPIIIE